MGKKQPFEMEFMFKSSPNILWNFLTSPSDLAQWFADEVDLDDGVYTFGWAGGGEERAKVLESAEPDRLRLRWEDSPEDEYVEFRIEKSGITGDTMLYIIDFAEKRDMADQEMLWTSQIDDLHKRIGG